MDYLKAAQPRVVSLFVVAVLAAILLCGGLQVWRAAVVLAATAATVGGAALLNNVIERESDLRMERTRRRPTATGRIAPARGALAGVLAVVAGSAALAGAAGPLAALFALLGAFYYVIVYTLLLKPRTALSAVPGGVAGIFPVLIGWAATGAGWSGAVLWLCVLITVWSPPHSWALTLALGEEYRASGIPTPPARYGETATRRLVAGFMVLLTAVLAAPLATGLFDGLYAGGAVAVALLLWVFTARLLRRADAAAAWALFKVTGPCLALALAAAIAARLI